MVPVFFDARGIIYTNFMLRGNTVNALSIKKAIASSLKVFPKMRPVMVYQDWFLHWDKAPVHSAVSVQDCHREKGIKTNPHLPYFPDLAPVDLFLFYKVKSALVGISLSQDSFKTTWDGVTVITNFVCTIAA
jgi:hypothetical protein